jgi:two-component system, OmpR family, sensor histidine kinase CpxA
MHRLHVKIFLWFWLAVVVVTATLGTLTELTHSRAEDDRRWEEKYRPRVDLWARQETQILRREGPKGLERYVGSFQSDPGVLNYIFDAEGREVLGRVPPPQVTGVVTAMAESTTGVQEVDAAERIIAERIIDARGNSHVVVVDFPSPSLLSRSLFEFLSTDFYTTGIDSTSLGRAIAVVAVAGVFCFLLAQHIARPIDRLRSAARRIADEQLQTRVDGSVLDRKDELADLGRDFDRMAERIEGLVTAQRHLLGDVSHALRSPLARLNVALGLARQRSGEPTSIHLDRIELEADRLNSLIGQLLKMARVDSGVDVEAPTEFDLGGVIEEVGADAGYEARHRGCTVRFTPNGACLVLGAREMLRGAVENVVRNAVRHTADRSAVEISMDRHEAAGQRHAVIRVRDHGPGVPEAALDGLFVPFHRATNGASSHKDGTGLGLAITKRTFEVHHGHVSAANAADGGLVVTLQLPLHDHA